MQLKNKVAIVTGASSGIGLATAKNLAAKGAKVALVSRTKNLLEAISKRLPNSIVVTADMSKTGDIKAMVKKVKNHYGKIDILVNNAGQGYDVPIEKINLKTFRQVFELDLVGPIVTMQETIPIMKKQREGIIINISSGTALMYLPNMGAYSSLKRALASISLTAREELKDSHIKVSVVYPYVTKTNFEKNTIKEGFKMAQVDDGDPPFPVDSSEYVAQKIVDAIKTGEAEVFAHDWMRPKAA